MKYFIIVIILLINSTFHFGQTGQVIENKVTLFSIKQKQDTIDFIVVDTLLNERKPIFLWCQGSLPVPLFCEIEGYGYYFLGGGISNFDYEAISKKFHLVIIFMPKVPVLVAKENLNNQYQYIPNIQEPNKFSDAYQKADFLDNYVHRGIAVLKFLQQQDWVSNEKLVVAGHSQGTKIATKIAVKNKKVSHLGLFAANPFGRIDQFIREIRLNAQLGKINWQTADSLMNNYYEFYKTSNNKDSIASNPNLFSLKTFSETFYDDWLKINIPIYLAYGTEDRTSDLCDIVPLLFIQSNKNNLTLKRYLGLEHNFFEVNERGQAIYEKGHWKEVMEDFIKWVK